MARVSPITTNFTAGEVSPFFEGRVDIGRYRNGTRELTNFIVRPLGGIYRRSGTRFVAEVKDSSKLTIIHDFEFSLTQAYILEMGDLYFRVFRDGAFLSVEEVTPYADTDLRQLRFAQSADKLFVVHPNFAPREIQRIADATWQIVFHDFEDGPYLPENETAITITPSATTGTVTLTASSAIFAATDVDSEANRSVTLTHGAVRGWARITAFASTTSVTAVVEDAFGAASATSQWRLGAWSVTTGFPALVSFFEERLVFANTATQPQTLFFSQSGRFTRHSPTEPDITVLDDNGINYTIASNKVNGISWLAPGPTLLIGTEGSEWQVRSAALGNPLTPENVRITPQTTYGSLNILQSNRIGSSVLFIQRSGRRLREMRFNFDIDAYVASDVSILNEHLLREGGNAVETAYQQEANTVFWIIMSDGRLLGMTYEREHEVFGWHRHIIGGSLTGSLNPEVESIASVHSIGGTEDSLYMVVKRTIDGVTERYIEFMEKDFHPVDEDDKDLMLFMDSALSYTGVPITTVTGLAHLEGETVTVLADGSAIADKVVSSGEIVLDDAASDISVGLQFVSRVRTLRSELGGEFGTAQGKTKRVEKLTLRLIDSLGFFHGTDAASLTEHSFRSSSDPMDQTPPLFTGDRPVNIEQSYKLDESYIIEQRRPYPLTILALMPEQRVYE